ncbi:PspC domain-containing protein [Streptomyces zagrosensis]|uniref:Phage shock protein PspC (Stress-responsive transcriptional regulator) n=1 Tax=Streptomyces zagrosensis TaxID=1042984 RepID=A0A7W9UXK6_9ACTN|nr:PspC domain-containing protein [Streptomyces zagrosensis]MBB5934742.1 phage shock protein PspC (stress-responsive transcriptional regulator) [Streptomyces zagrosensis]
MTDAPAAEDGATRPPAAPGGATATATATATEPPQPARPPLRRSREHKLVSGVCGGLGRYCDLDPVLFRVVLAVLGAAGGVGLIVYGFAWLLIPLAGEDQNEGRRLLSGRVEGSALTAVLAALVGCGLFLSMLNNGSVVAFSMMLSLAAAGAGYWSRHRRHAENDGAVDPATAQAVADAPPETRAPPVPGSPSWWRDPIVKDGTTGLPRSARPAPAAGYLWGPDDTPYEPRTGSSVAAPPVPRGDAIGGRTFLLALCAAAIGTGSTWDTQPLGTSLEVGLACALAVFGIALTVSSLYGRTSGGTIVSVVLTAALLASAAALPKSVTTDWQERTWRPVKAADLRPRYELGTGHATLNLASLRPGRDRTLTTRASVGAGKLEVTVPTDVTLRLSVQVGLGDLQLPGEQQDDVDVAPRRSREVTVRPMAGSKPLPAAKTRGTLVLDLDVGVGQVAVVRQ